MKVSALTVLALTACGQAQASLLRKKASNDIEQAAIDSLDEDNEWFERFVQEVSSIDPTPPPTAPPTGLCEANVVVDCTYTVDENGTPLPCKELPPVDNPYCTCAECVREVVFVYTGKPCNGLEGCADPGTSVPGESVDIAFAACGSNTNAYEQTVMSGDTITINFGDTCLPECMDVTVSEPGGTETQTFSIDTSCDDRELLLKDSYGSIDFIGYTCDETNVNNCFQEVIYEVEACNIGSEDLTIYDLLFYFNGETEDLLEDGEEPVLETGECYDAVVNEIVDRCTEAEYCANATMNATDPVDGPVCEDMEELKFSIVPGTVDPTPAPSPAPSAAPIAPTPFPTTLTPPPTGDCNLNVTVAPECPVIECGWDRCRARPFRMEFRMSPRACADSILKRCPGQDPDTCTCIRNVTIPEEDWAEQQFICDDFNGGPVDPFASYYVTSTPEKDENIIYFEGPVSNGGRFNASAQEGEDEVEANTFLNLYTYPNGTIGELVQQVIFHSSCSQQLYLLDVFGSFQLVEFESTSQLVGFGVNPSVGFNIALEVESETLEMSFLSVVVLSGVPGLLPPQTEIFDVEGVIIPPPYDATTNITLIPDQDFTVITTVSGEIDGIPCSDITQSTINCPGTVEPDVARWLRLAPSATEAPAGN
jgi:hypothetical protein